MFGYIRPMQPEMKVRELEQFKACYCALCKTLGQKYGIASRFILNYDFVFLTMLLWSPKEACLYENGKCLLRPVKGKKMCRSSETLDRCAGYSIILAYWKLKDSIADDGFPKSLEARAAMLLLKRAYKKASKVYPDFADTVKTALNELSVLEKAGESSIDKMADKFAGLLCAVLDPEKDRDERAKKQILYHVGRWIYIIDAVNDIEEDKKTGSYNAAAARYGLTEGKLSENARQEIIETLAHSENMVTSAYELLPENSWAEIIRNIIYLGIPTVGEAVFNGSFVNSKERMPR